MINLHHIDCTEYMKDVPDKHFELAIVDPPYGYGHDRVNFRYSDDPTKKTYSNTAPKEEYFIELFRTSKNQIIWGANYFTPFLGPRKSWLCWNKGQPIDSFSDCELAWTSLDILTLHLKLDSYGFNHADKRNGFGSTIHPTQKPVYLYKHLLTKFAKEGDKILDTHGGSMSIAIACHDLGFDLELCELDKDYYDAGVKRYKQHISQLNLLNLLD